MQGARCVRAGCRAVHTHLSCRRSSSSSRISPLGSLRASLYRTISGPISFQKLSIRERPTRALLSSTSGSDSLSSPFSARAPQENLPSPNGTSGSLPSPGSQDVPFLSEWSEPPSGDSLATFMSGRVT